jgi:hypothetical protein
LAPYDLSRIELSNIATKHSHSETSEDETSSGPLKQPIPELIHGDIKKSAAIDLPPKIPINSNNVANEDILQWLEKQNPQLADSFTNEFRISTTQPTRLFPKAKVIAQGPTPTPEPVTNNTTTTTMTVNYLIDDLTKQYQELNEDGQKDLWLGALASNDTNLIQALTKLRLRQNASNSKTQLAKLTKDLLTHCEKHKVTELRYEEQAGK